ncbi:MAG TPA: ribosome silencing factor [Vicinamibacterales bacterium]|jgi:ribosome-associated protein|nr:ribosome silencing factor [Vicinamibacterales bacterium]
MAKTSASKKVATPRRKTAAKLPKSVLGAVHAVQDKKGIDVVVLDLRKAGGFTDFFVICTGTNPRQMTAIADSVEDTLRTDFGERPHLTEGAEKSQWILLDYFNFVVHVFSRECRNFYELERLWGNAERHDFSEEASTP